tara:strand:+ start:925 stop:1071 length:147 start_codon:yes stop_codon:yes gene_type:complete
MMMIIDAVVAEQKRQSDETKKEMQDSDGETPLDSGFSSTVLNNPNQYK